MSNTLVDSLPKGTTVETVVCLTGGLVNELQPDSCVN